MKKKKKALFVTYGGSHAKITYAVSTYLNSHTDIEVVVLALTTARNYFQSRGGVETLSYSDFAAIFDSNYNHYGRKLAERFHNPNVGIELEDSIAYLGINFLDILTQNSEEEAFAKIEKFDRHAFYPVWAMAKIIDKIDPDIIISTNSPKSEKAAVKVGKDRGIPTVCIVDLFGKGDFYIPEADKVCVLSEITRDYYIQNGMPKEAIEVTGNPMFDELFLKYSGAKSNKSWDAIESLLWCDQGANLLLDGKTVKLYSREEIVNTLDQVRDAVFSQGLKKFSVRPHPSQDNSIHKEWVDGLNDPRVIYAGDDDLYALINSVDILATRTSTTSLEALLLDTSVIIVNPENEFQPLPFESYNLVMASEGFSGLEDAIAKVVSSSLEERGNTLERVAAVFPQRKGDGSKRVAEVIQELLQNSIR